MNNYRYDEIETGVKESFTVTVSEEQMDSFRAMSGDVNPLHRDADFAEKRGYAGTVVFGMLTASFYSTLCGVYLPGERCLLHSVDSKFMKPVYVGDTLTIEGTVTEKNDTFRLLTIKAVIKNQKGEKVSKAVIQAGVLEEA